MQEFGAWLGASWGRHAADPEGVAASLRGAIPRVTDETERVGLARLAHHVFGEHLGAWADGRRLLAELAAGATDGSSAALRRFDASLALSGEEADLRPGLSLSDRVGVAVLAAGNLATRDSARAATLLHDALAEAADLPAGDPNHRLLAITGNNIACALEERPGRDDAERALMILAAETGRRFWEVAGSWLEVERAEYRLAMTWIQAGDPARARAAAERCLTIVSAQTPPAPGFEHFFAWEALARAAHAGADRSGLASAVSGAREVFEALDPDDRAACAPTLAALGTL